MFQVLIMQFKIDYYSAIRCTGRALQPVLTAYSFLCLNNIGRHKETGFTHPYFNVLPRIFVLDRPWRFL